MFLGIRNITFFKIAKIESMASAIDHQLLVVVFGLAFSVFVILRIAKLLSKIKIN
tara:strand:+ start:215 stop:379 length:165 start_codon:yes stop_codon:yes gene_type:complete